MTGQELVSCCIGKQATLPLSEVRAALKRESSHVDSWLAAASFHKDTPEALREAMAYSLLGGGKRIRPILCLLSARLLSDAEQRNAHWPEHGGKSPMEHLLPFAGALECIHTYSLIHDDLPAMDNDDLRRGRPSNHKQFDEATAILAGDGLLTDAFALMASVGEGGIIPAQRVLRAITLTAKAAGSSGMVGGQFLDMRYTGQKNVSLKELAAMQVMKTGALLRVACVAGAVLAGADEKNIQVLHAYGTALGIAFQIADDILDETGDQQLLGKPVGSDAACNKNTYPALLGIDKSRELALQSAADAANALQEFEGYEAAFLRGLASYVVHRVS